jgi:hypothetical protein
MKRKKSIIFVSVATVFLVTLSLCESVGAEQRWQIVTIGPEGNAPFNCLTILDERVAVADTSQVVIYDREWSDASGSSYIASYGRKGKGHTGDDSHDGVPNRWGDCW